MSERTMQAGVVGRARGFAERAHGGQRYGERPYVYHLDMVAELLKPYGEEAQVAGYLHDVVEDAGVTLEQVRAEFGDLVAECVGLVTDEPGENRKERKTRTYAKLAKAEGPARLALIVKAADRLANLRMSVAGGNERKLAMYREEHPALRAAAYRPGLCDEFWGEMERIVGEGHAVTK